jgi:hypothetical protein
MVMYLARPSTHTFHSSNSVIKQNGSEGLFTFSVAV